MASDRGGDGPVQVAAGRDDLERQAPVHTERDVLLIACRVLNIATVASLVLCALGLAVTMREEVCDHVIVQARAGNGGQGCASVQKGRSRSMKFQPDGGNGGDGGDVVLRASREVKSLAGLPQLLVSSHGGNGTSKKQHGRRGSDGLYLVPLGTRVRAFQERSRFHKKHSIEAPPSIAPEDVNDMVWILALPLRWHLICPTTGRRKKDAKETVEFEYMQDLLEHGDEIVVAKGGHGGKGNCGYVSKRHRMTQQQAAASTFGESVRLELEMKLISDFSLVGFPNVGKSSLLRSISAAVPKLGRMRLQQPPRSSGV
eukprot:jgi/Picre1/28060/NNA_001019.t1